MQAAMIGIGAIGRPMAERVVDAGIPLRVYDVARAQVDALVARGALAASSPAEAAAGADVVAAMVRTDEQLLDSALGEQGALAAMPKGAVFVVQSTLVPETIRRLAAAASELGLGVVDAPVTGGEGGARAGTLTVMAGGDPSDLERCRPVLDAMSKNIVHCGAVGSGTIAKLCNNLVNYMGYQAAFEADRLARASGLETALLDEVLETGGLMNDSMRRYLALLRGEVGSLETLQPMLERITELAEKDLSHTLSAAREVGLELPGSALCQQQMASVYGLSPKE